MIPKVIHYCWFGRGQLPDLALKCIDSWKKHLPDYEFKHWNEDTFDVNCVPYVKEAYEARKFAFVTDYVRLYALFYEGGVYMDTDVEVLKPLDDLLELSAFSGYESNKNAFFPTGLMATAKGGVWVQEQMAYYADRHFINSDGTYDMTTNTVIISMIMQNNGFVLDGKYNIYKNDMHCFPSEYFCPKTSTGVLKITDNTYCIHHFAGSWNTLSFSKKAKKQILKILGPKLTDFLVNLKWKIKK